jgi:hypothetical protein
MKFLTIFAILFSAALACGPEPAHITKKRLALEALQPLPVLDANYLIKRESAECNELKPGAPASSKGWNWRPLRIFFSLAPFHKGLIAAGKASRIQFYNNVFEATKAWYAKSLKVRDRQVTATGKPIMSTMIDHSKKTSEKPEDDIDMNGQDPNNFDLIAEVSYFPNGLPGANPNVLAWAAPVYRHECTGRAIAGVVGINGFGDSTWSYGEMAMNQAMSVIIHEFAHIIGFLGWEEYQWNNIAQDPVVGWKWVGPKVLERARAHWQCKAGQVLDGVPLEVEEKDGKKSIGAHWAEEQLGTEAMTPIVGGDPDIISNLSLA